MPILVYVLDFGAKEAIAATGAYLGAHLAGFLGGALQLTFFATVMLVAALFMFRNGDPDERAGKDYSDGSSAQLLLRFAVPGIGVGVLTGLVGVGGGFLIVPSLVLLGGVPMEAAVGTSLLVITINSFAGAYLVRLVSQHALQRGFAGLLVVMAAFILYENQAAIPFL